MRILAIETSCDETAVAVLEAVRNKVEIKSSIIASQVKLHSKYGGVFPSLAKREHQRNLVPVIKKALQESDLLKLKTKTGRAKTQLEIKNIEKILEREPELLKKTAAFLKKYAKPDIDAIAVTTGPGLEIALWVGVNFAKALGYFWELPIISVNHVEAHILANFIGESSKTIRQPTDQKILPAICLVVSGGHTQLILMTGIGKYKLIGETRDDAAGECFDKAARILGLGYPGGPIIAQIADRFIKADRDMIPVNLPRPMMYAKNYDFSFSGLKTAVLYEFKKQSEKTKGSKNYTQAMCREIQQAIIDVLIWKTLKAAKDFKAKAIILGGGVTANQELRKQFKEKIGKEISEAKCLIPGVQYSTDNAAMIALTAYLRDNKENDLRRIKVDANLKI